MSRISPSPPSPSPTWTSPLSSASSKAATWARAWSQFYGIPDLPHCDPRATLVIYEQLRQEKQVADMLGLTSGEIEDHFSGNGKRFIARIRSGRTL